MKKDALTPRKIKSMSTKAKLFRTAIDLFKEHGFDAVTVDDIVSQADSSKGAFYTHFKSKVDILVEQFKEIDQYYLKNAKKYRNKNKKSSENLLAFFKSSASYIMRKVGLDTTKVVYCAQIKEGIQAYILNKDRAINKIVLEIIEDGQKSGEFIDDLNAEELAEMAIKSMRGLLYNWCLYEGKYNLIKDCEKFYSIFMKGLLKQNDPWVDSLKPTGTKMVPVAEPISKSKAL